MNAQEPVAEVEGAMVSYAQWGEDVVLRRFFRGQRQGVYVDVGANDPVVDSVTQHFYLSGWAGVNVEPIPEVYTRLVAQRPRDTNLNVAISNASGEAMFVVNRSAPGLSTFTEELAESYAGKGHELARIRVATMPLDDVLREHVREGKTLDFLKVDVEGHEHAVLHSVDLRKWRPRVIVVEAGHKPERWEPELLAAGYLLAGSHSHNRYYVATEEGSRAQLLATPANVTDNYVRWTHAHALQEWEALGPALRSVVRRLRRLKEMSPGVKQLAKRVLRSAVPGLFEET